jgi:transmembrane sensor
MQDREILELLKKYRQGHATAEEVAWMESAYLDWNEDELQAPSDQLLDASVQEIRAHVMKATHPVPVGKLWKRLSAAAAIILFLAAGAWLALNNFSQAPHVEIAKGTKDLQPGTDKATLILANGQHIDLTGAASGQIASSEKGIKIMKSADGQLTYEASEQEQTPVNSLIAYNTISTPAGGKYRVLLPDSTQVWLNASSSLTFPTSFKNAESREVRLKGEGYFEVAKMHHLSTNIPFRVITDKQVVKVLGTHFNVNAYEDESTATTTLLEGSIEINGEYLLKPGQQASGQGQAIKLKNVAANDFIDWKSGDFNLNNGNFRSVMRKIGRWYDVEIFYDETAPERVKDLGGWISREKSLTSVLNIMQQTGKVHFKLEGRRVTVSK